jgi:hypothetical protein
MGCVSDIRKFFKMRKKFGEYVSEHGNKSYSEGFGTGYDIGHAQGLKETSK